MIPSFLLPQRGREMVKKLRPLGQAGISSKFCKCGHFEGDGNNALQVLTVIEIFHRE
jgi:hypothetical protein